MSGDGIGFDPDAYYHIGVARLYGTEGWLSTFPWLKFTVLGPAFPNAYVGQHLLLAPLTLLFEPVTALKVGVVLLSSMLVVSVYAVLRRWHVPHAALWAVLGAFSSPVLISVNSTIKGGALFFVLLVWYIAGVWSRSAKATFFLAWASVYIYVGAPVLIGVALLFMLVDRVWSGTWDGRVLMAAGLGLLCGYVVNPFWPDHWLHTARELGTAFYVPRNIVPGEFLGTEWSSIPGKLLIEVAGLHLGIWFALVILRLRSNRRASIEAAAGAVVALGFLAAAIMTAKFLPLFFIASMLFAPRLASEMRPWLGAWSAQLLTVAAAVVAAVNIGQSYRTVHWNPNRPEPLEFAKAAEQLKAMTPAGQVVVAAWDDFPGLFLFDQHNTYVAGMNPLFLLWASEKQFLAYSYLYQGKVSDPEKLLPMFFDDAEIILVRKRTRTAGERTLIQRLLRSEHFEEIRSSAETWRMFRLTP